jgi:hypothetical protein
LSPTMVETHFLAVEHHLHHARVQEQFEGPPQRGDASSTAWPSSPTSQPIRSSLRCCSSFSDGFVQRVPDLLRSEYAAAQ